MPGGKGPLLAAIGVDGIELVIMRAHIDGSIRTYGRRGVQSVSSGKGPFLTAVGVDGIKIVIKRAHIDGSIRANRRR